MNLEIFGTLFLAFLLVLMAHGGRIWVESAGHDEINFPGSQFHAFLPLLKQEVGNTIPMGGAVSVQFGQPIQKPGS